MRARSILDEALLNERAGDAIDDGSLLYDANSELRELDASGAIRAIWSCRQQFGQDFACYSNTINGDPVRSAVLISFPEPGPRSRSIARVGSSWANTGMRPVAGRSCHRSPRRPAAWGFGFQHFPNFTAEGTLMVSSHIRKPVWQVELDTPGGSDFFNKMVSHNVLIDDLYLLDGGVQQ
jgi:hypothetical protein